MMMIRKWFSRGYEKWLDNKTFNKVFAVFTDLFFWMIKLINLMIGIPQKTEGRIVKTLCPPPKWLIVPGCGIHPDGSISETLRRRLNDAFFLLEEFPNARALLSGDGQRYDYDEPAAMYQNLVKRGIASDRLVLDKGGLCTIDTMERAYTLFNISRALIVTSDFHEVRCVYIALQTGIDAFVYDAEKSNELFTARYRLRDGIAIYKDIIVIQNRKRRRG